MTWLRLARRWRWLAFAGAALSIYPASVLGTVYWQTQHSALEGGRNGPRDAYRHTLASAIVAYTLAPGVVDMVTTVMEGDGSASAARAMDAQNNRIGARIGATAGSWDELLRRVRVSVAEGAVDAEDPEQSTWLPADTWAERLY
ncbi:hypothetical protein [Pseudoxanthomonas putridarboris]|uniref:Uncharacterized protein n=1 Tax=Pseudoxanthomonas putridarboris TaxID=752605 RepID=A0ABU9J018_9GAMM